jgi:hypothetical protein
MHNKPRRPYNFNHSLAYPAASYGNALATGFNKMR